MSLWSAIRDWFRPLPTETIVIRGWSPKPTWLVLEEGQRVIDASTTGQEAAKLLEEAAATIRKRDADYKGSDKMYADLMRVLFPDGVVLVHERDHHRFHLFMLAMVKVTRYARNWSKGHEDSLIDLAAYAGMLLAVDRSSSLPREGD